MERRTDAVELLDGPLDDPAALTANLRDLRRINDRLGGVSLSAPAIEALAAHRDELTLLDVGTGGADIPLALIDLASAAGRRLTIVAIDSRPEVLSAAVLACYPIAPSKRYLNSGALQSFNSGMAESTISLYVDGVFRQKVQLTSKYAWSYGGEEETFNVPKAKGAHHFYDEARALVGDIPAGAIVKFQIDVCSHKGRVITSCLQKLRQHFFQFIEVVVLNYKLYRLAATSVYLYSLLLVRECPTLRKISKISAHHIDDFLLRSVAVIWIYKRHSHEAHVH
jgi:hypothetical protein